MEWKKKIWRTYWCDLMHFHYDISLPFTEYTVYTALVDVGTLTVVAALVVDVGSVVNALVLAVVQLLLISYTYITSYFLK